MDVGRGSAVDCPEVGFEDIYRKQVSHRRNTSRIRFWAFSYSMGEPCGRSTSWFRFAFKWTDAKTGEAQSQAGMQAYRIANGKLAETWLTLLPLGSAWPDAVAQEHWTSPPSIE